MRLNSWNFLKQLEPKCRHPNAIHAKRVQILSIYIYIYTLIRRHVRDWCRTVPQVDACLRVSFEPRNGPVVNTKSAAHSQQFPAICFSVAFCLLFVSVFAFRDSACVNACYRQLRQRRQGKGKVGGGAFGEALCILGEGCIVWIPSVDNLALHGGWLISPFFGEV